MATAIRRYKMPRSLLTPQQISRQKQEEISRPMDHWQPQASVLEAGQVLERLGVAPLEKPIYDPSMPDNVVVLTNEELGTLHAQFVAFCTYLDEQRAMAEVEADEEQALFEHVAAEIHLRKTGTVPDKKYKTINDVRYVEAEQRLLIAKARAKMLKVRTQGYERCSAALSREMTRRGLLPREH